MARVNEGSRSFTWQPH